MSSRTLSAAIAAVFCVTATVLQAGECPKDQVLTEPMPLEQIKPDKLVREVLSNVRLEGWRDMGGFILRMRRLTLEPGGFVPTHRHDDRPAIVYIVSGTVTEHNSFCKVPVVYHAGDVSTEFGPGYEHWWENTGTEPVIFISTDVLPFTGEAPPFVGFEP